MMNKRQFMQKQMAIVTGSNTYIEATDNIY